MKKAKICPYYIFIFSVLNIIILLSFVGAYETATPTINLGVQEETNPAVNTADLACPNGMAGSGIEGDECQITSWTDLNAIRDGLNLHYKLMNDLSSETEGYAGFR
jgi:hypothetical protein